MKERIIARLKDLIVNTDNCINYPITNKDGYGEYQPRYKGKKFHVLMHRASYLYFVGDIQEGNIICHTCDNPACINPKHLFQGSHADNVQDKVNKNRQAKGNNNGRYIDGRASDNKKYSEYYANRSIPKELAIEIKKRIRNKESLVNISRDLDVKYQTIRDISCGRVYKDIE